MSRWGLSAGAVLHRSAGFAQEIPGTHGNAERGKERAADGEGFGGPGEERSKIGVEGRLPDYGRRHGAMGEGPDETGRNVDAGERAQSAEPESSAVAQVQASAAAGFQPDVGGVGRAIGAFMREESSRRAAVTARVSEQAGHDSA